MASYRLSGKLLSALPAVALVAAACLGGGGGDEERQVMAGVDLSKHSAPLDAIRFDTFDGRSIPLSRISEEQMEALRDAIPPLDNPKYDQAADGDWLQENDLVIGYVSASGRPFAYPLKILNWHEIVNDEIEGLPVLVTYCPLCRSGVVYDRRLDARLLSFGNTSALYESDLVMYDRETNSYWWQTAGEAIVGTLTGKRLTALPAVTITWGEWKALHPDTQVLSRDTGFVRSYGVDTYGDYYADIVNSGRFLFPVSDAVKDDRLAPAEEVLGVTLGDESKAYPLRLLGDAAVNDTLDGQRIVAFARASGPSGNVFRPEAGGRELTFAFRDGAYVDQETGSQWDLSGRATAGPLKGQQLEPLPSRYTFWFAYAAAFPETEVYTP